jgi:AraC-like DNA-binding protein
MDCVCFSIAGEHEERIAGFVTSQCPSGKTARPASGTQEPSESAVRRAEELLATTNLPARQIASQAGIPIDWLNSIFRARYGLTPGQYRVKTLADRWLQRLQHEDSSLWQILRVTGVRSDAGFLERCQTFEPRAQAKLHRFRLTCLMTSIDFCDPSEVASVLPPELQQLPITALAMPSRAANACRRAGISTVGAILTLTRTPLDVVPGLGKVSMRNLTTALWNALEAYVSYLERSCCESTETPRRQNKRLTA